MTYHIIPSYLCSRLCFHQLQAIKDTTLLQPPREADSLIVLVSTTQFSDTVNGRALCLWSSWVLTAHLLHTLNCRCSKKSSVCFSGIIWSLANGL